MTFSIHIILCATQNNFYGMSKILCMKKDQQSNNNFILIIYETKFITQWKMLYNYSSRLFNCIIICNFFNLHVSQSSDLKGHGHYFCQSLFFYFHYLQCFSINAFLKINQNLCVSSTVKSKKHVQRSRFFVL